MNLKELFILIKDNIKLINNINIKNINNIINKYDGMIGCSIVL